MDTGLNLDQFSQLAQHLVILGDLLVVARSTSCAMLPVSLADLLFDVLRRRRVVE